MRVTVLTGGTSSERDVALASAVQVIAALRSRRHEVAVVDTARGYIPQSDETALLSGIVGTEPPSSVQLHALERGLLLSGLANLAVVQDADVLFLALMEAGVGAPTDPVEMVGCPYTEVGRLGVVAWTRTSQAVVSSSRGPNAIGDGARIASPGRRDFGGRWCKGP